MRAENKSVAFKTQLHKRTERAYVPVPAGCVLTLPWECDPVRETLGCISTAIISLMHSFILLLYPSRSPFLSCLHSTSRWLLPYWLKPDICFETRDPAPVMQSASLPSRLNTDRLIMMRCEKPESWFKLIAQIARRSHVFLCVEVSKQLQRQCTVRCHHLKNKPQHRNQRDYFSKMSD